LTKVYLQLDNSENFKGKCPDYRNIIKSYSGISVNIYKKEDLPIENNLLTIYLMSDGAHYYWEDRPRFSLNTLNNVNRFSASLMRRIE
jgi:hypothetical protein